jgi:hypothetical protein
LCEARILGSTDDGRTLEELVRRAISLEPRNGGAQYHAGRNALDELRLRSMLAMLTRTLIRQPLSCYLGLVRGRRGTLKSMIKKEVSNAGG